MVARLTEGFPPASQSQVTLANWRQAPFNQWAFHHVREIIASADIPHDPSGVRELKPVPRDLGHLRVTVPDGRTPSLRQFLDVSSTDGIVILHKGALL
jgi:hypothetical protein